MKSVYYYDIILSFVKINYLVFPDIQEICNFLKFCRYLQDAQNFVTFEK